MEKQSNDAKAHGNQMLRNIMSHREIILTMSLRDLQTRYVGTLGGTLWAFVHPLSIVLIFYFVFAVGFRTKGPTGTSFILWFVCGLAPWFFFGETLKFITDSVSNSRHLVKKTVFPTETLPLVHLVSGLFTHVIFLFIIVGLLVYYKVPFHFERILFVYFLICNCALLLGLGWMLSALQVFYPDITQGLTIILNLCFWVTPIVWPLEILPQKYHILMIYNPMYYIVEGYRGLLIFDKVVWPSIGATLYFWGVTTTILLVGSYIFRRLKPEFADIL